MVCRVWRKYRARKSTLGIWCDFVVLIAVVILAVPSLRFLVNIGIVRLMSCQPSAVDVELYVSNTDGLDVRTSDGADTCILCDITSPALYNFGSLKSAQTCAELRSLNKFALKYCHEVEVFFLTEESPDEVIPYFSSHGYVVKPLFYHRTDDFTMQHDMISELCSSEPATLLVNADGRVIIKKFGAAKWTGKKIDHIVSLHLISGGSH